MGALPFHLPIFLLTLLFTLSACDGSAPAGDPLADILEIGDRFFATRIHDILFDPNRYVGRAIQYEGIFWRFPLPEGNLDMVFRLLSSCCTSMEVGFEVYLNEVARVPNDTWVEVLGILEPFDYQGQTFFRLQVISMEERPERGVDFVFN